MPNPRAQRPLSLQAVTEDIRSLAKPAEALLDMLAGAAKGSVSATLGVGGDIRELVNLLGEDRVKQILGERSLPTTEEVSAKLPAVVPTTAPLSRQQSAGYGQTMGEFIPTPGSGRVVQGGLNAIKSIPAAVQHGAQEFAKASAMGVPHVVKPKGGNWFGNNVEHELKSLKTPMSPNEVAGIEAHLKKIEPFYDLNNPTDVRELANMRQHIEVMKRNEAVNNWVDRNLTNYVKKEMATPEDPVRKLAEQGVTHFPIAGEPDYWARHGRRVREDLGGEEMAQSPLAKQWENRTDAMITRDLAQEHQDMMHLSPGMYSDKDEWIKKLAPDTPLYSADQNKFNQLDLGFDHIIDVLKQDLAEGRIRPEQLNKVSMEQAVRRTYEYDQEMAKKMREAAIKQTEGMPVHKEYPEGYKWIELKANKNLPSEDDGFGNMSSPGYEDLEKALKYEGNTMGHCVGGYCDDVYEGRSRIYSLRDAKGEPHVTVEVQPRTRNTKQRTDWFANQPESVQNQITQEALELEKSYGTGLEYGSRDNWQKAFFNVIDKSMGEEMPSIVQIKGKQNAAPKEQYLPYVQDFVKGGQWTDVGDIKNTGLRLTSDAFNANELQKIKESGIEVPRYATQEEIKAIGDQVWPGMWGDTNYKSGGKVHVSDNPDTMQLELAGGGLTKLARLARAPAKSKEEIRAVAERIAPQMTGEYVRGKEGAKTVAGKTQKQFEREKSLEHDIRPTEGVEQRIPEKIDYENFKNNVIMGIAGDPTITGKTVYGVAGTPLQSPAPQHGGPLYGLGRDDAHFWASNKGAAQKVQNLSKEIEQQYDQPVLGQYVMMGPDSYSYAQHFADANINLIDPTKMSKKDIESFNQLVREGYPYIDSQKVKRQRVFPSFPGIENPEEMYLQFAIDPDMRKHFGNLMQMTTVTESRKMPSGLDVSHAVTEPGLRDLEIGVTGHSVGRMLPDVKDLKLSEHPTYSHDIPGHFLGQSKYPIPYDLMFPDTVKAVRENPKQAPQEFGSFKMVGPRQTIDQQMIDEIKMYEEMIKSLTGKKKGGVIKKATGGEITADDLTIEERPL